MQFTVLQAKDSDSGKRLDVFLAGAFKGKYSRTYLKRLILDGKVIVDGEAKVSHHKLTGREKISVGIPPPRIIEVKPENIPLDIVFEDDFVLVVNKRAGMVAHPGVGNFSGTLLNAVLYHCERLSSVGGKFKSGIVHRLDKDTSGLMVIAKDDATHRSLAAQFKKREVLREYVALVKGVVEFDEGIVDAPLGRDSCNRKKVSVDFSQEKQSVTMYKVIRRFKDCTLLKIMPKTGRMHQIRVHMKYIGYPILGDAAYGVKSDMPRQALHAMALGFRHPATGKVAKFSSKMPEDMKSFIKKLA